MGAAEILDRKLTAVLAHDDTAQFEFYDPAIPHRPGRGAFGLDVRRAIDNAEDVVHGSAYRAGFRPPRQLLRNRVEINDKTVPIGGEDRVADGVQGYLGHVRKGYPGRDLLHDRRVCRGSVRRASRSRRPVGRAQNTPPPAVRIIAQLLTLETADRPNGTQQSVRQTPPDTTQRAGTTRAPVAVRDHRPGVALRVPRVGLRGRRSWLHGTRLNVPERPVCATGNAIRVRDR
jgi:hypothetical protein